MNARLDTDVCVIGGGTGGMIVAAAAAQLGVATVLVERGAPGGASLHSGCVPAKALLAAAGAAQAARAAGAFGITLPDPAVAFDAVMAHVADVIAAVAPNHAADRLAGLGVKVVTASARFIAPDRLLAGTTEIRARRFVIATGSVPVVPAISGLDSTPYLTSDTVLGLKALPSHLLVLGAGPAGLEYAQAFRRLGSAVTAIDCGPALRDADPEAVALLAERLRAEGLTLLTRTTVARLSATTDGVAAHLPEGRRLAASHLLLACGRQPAIEGLGLEAAGVRLADGAIVTDAGLRTSNRRIYALGDVTGGPGLASVATAQAGLVLRGLLFRLPARPAGPVPRVTGTDPELAQVGLTEAEARARDPRIDVLRVPFADNVRAQAMRRDDGLIKVTVDARGRILGVTILGAGAGELIAPWVLAMRHRLRIDAMAGLPIPFPTRADISRSVAGSWLMPRLLGAGSRRLVRWLRRLP